MPQLVKKRRSGWAVLAAGALVASLLAVGAAPAAADVDKADHEADTSACVGGALDDDRFTDVGADHFHADAINCIAYYGITNGTGDGSTYSPNAPVTRAQMAVFIARAAGVAGVDLDDAMGDEFTDIGDTWSDAQDAINSLAESGVIASGGAFRPDDDITRAEMATFLVGLLVQASDNVSVSNGVIMLGGTNGVAIDDYFGDARASVPRSVDAEISAIYELGVTEGRSAAAGAEEGKAPLDLNYEPHGTVTRGQMAAFITRALAHTSARPVGVTAQWDGEQVVVSARDADFQPRPDVVVDVISTATGDADLAFASNGRCDDVDDTYGGTHVCEIDNTDDETDNDGDLTVDVESGNTVWVWTGDTGDTVDSGTELYRLNIAKQAPRPVVATRVHVSTDFAGSKVRLGSSVVYTVQLQSAADKATTVGTDGKKPASFLVTLSTIAMVDADDDPATAPTRAAAGHSSVTTQKITTDADGKATFSVSAPADPAPVAKQDKFQVDIAIAASDNAPDADTDTYFTGDPATALTAAAGRATVKSGASDVDDGLTFSTEASTSATEGTLTVKTAAEHVIASARGASNSVTVTVTDQYGDPVSGASVTLTSTLATADDGVEIARPTRITGRDGSRTFRYERESAASATETLTATWDPDGGAAPSTADAVTATETVEWASTTVNESQTTGVAILEVDTDTDTIFVGSAGSVIVIRYDSNDRYNIDPDGTGDMPVAPSTYAAFDKSISKADTLTWTRAGTSARSVNTYTLIKPTPSG